MKLNKCTRCGCFFAAGQEMVCPDCAKKDNYEIAKLQEFIEEHGMPSSIENLCDTTHIARKNMDRYLAQDAFASFPPLK